MSAPFFVLIIKSHKKAGAKAGLNACLVFAVLITQLLRRVCVQGHRELA
jgi:hypothetical protein